MTYVRTDWIPDVDLAAARAAAVAAGASAENARTAVRADMSSEGPWPGAYAANVADRLRARGEHRAAEAFDGAPPAAPEWGAGLGPLPEDD